MKNTLALFNHLAYLKAIPAAFLFAQDVVRSNIKLEDAPSLLVLGSLDCAPDKESDDREENKHRGGNPHDIQHGDDNQNRQNPLYRFSPLGIHKKFQVSSFKFQVHSSLT